MQMYKQFLFVAIWCLQIPLGSTSALAGEIRLCAKILQENFFKIPREHGITSDLRELEPTRPDRVIAEKILSYNPDGPQFNLSLENGGQNIRAVRLNAFDSGDEIMRLFVDEFNYAYGGRSTPHVFLVGNVGYAESKERKKIERDFKRMRLPQYEVIHSAHVAPWAQDGSKPINKPAENLATLIPRQMATARETSHYINPITALQVHSGLQVEKSQFRWEGGDIVVGQNHVFVGSSVLDMANQDFGMSASEALAALSREFSKPVIPIGVFDQVMAKRYPIEFHIDLFLSVVRDRFTGQDVILLGSVQLAVNLIQGISPDTGTIRVSKKTGQRRLSKLFDYLLGEGVQLENEIQKVSDNLRTEQNLNELASFLSRLGYRVIRLPYLSLGPSRYDLNSRMSFLSYNNIIVDGERVLTSRLGIPELDEYSNSVFSSLGYRAYGFTTAEASLYLDGGIRCLSEIYRCPPNQEQ